MQENRGAQNAAANLYAVLIPSMEYVNHERMNLFPNRKMLYQPVFQ